MRLLLDTHILLWWLAGDRRLSAPIREAVADPETDVVVSAVSAWEIAIKKALGKLRAPDDLEAQMVAQGFGPLPITVRHALLAGALPRHHEDPFDRMLVAQAHAEQLTLVSVDPWVSHYEVAVLR